MQNLGPMDQPDLPATRRATLTDRQTAATASIRGMAPMGHALIDARWPEGIPRFLIPGCRKDRLELPSETPVTRLTGNCVARAFGMGAKHVTRNFRFRPAAPAGWKRDLRVWWNGPPE
jgi:hypothetical protein